MAAVTSTINLTRPGSTVVVTGQATSFTTSEVTITPSAIINDTSLPTRSSTHISTITKTAAPSFSFGSPEGIYQFAPATVRSTTSTSASTSTSTPIPTFISTSASNSNPKSMGISNYLGIIFGCLSLICVLGTVYYQYRNRHKHYNARSASTLPLAERSENMPPELEGKGKRAVHEIGPDVRQKAHELGGRELSRGRRWLKFYGAEGDRGSASRGVSELPGC